MGHRSRMQSVELLDDVHPPDEPSPRTTARRRRRRALAVAVVVALAVVGTQALLLARERAAANRIEALPGVVRGVGADVAELWRVERRDVEYLDRAVHVGGTVVGVRTALDGAQRIEARDATTGHSRWSAPLRGPDAELALRGGDATRSTCQQVPPAQGDDTRLVACLGSDAAVSIGDRGRTTYVRAPVRSHLVVIDAADGHVVADQPAPAATDFTTLPGVVVLGAPGDDGHAEVTAQDLLTGERVWSFVSPTPGIAPAGDVAGFRVFRLGGRVGVQESGRQVTLLSAEGDIVRERSDVLDGSPVLVRDERLELLSGFADGRPTTTIVRPGRPDTTVSGYLLARSVDDGSLDDVEITYGSAVRAWDASTGDPLWSTDGPVGGPAIVLHGLVFCMSGASAGAVLAFDGRTGALVWTMDGGSYDQVQTLLTNGTAIVVANTPAPGERASTLDAFAIDTGERLWRTSTPVLLAPVAVRSGLLVAGPGGGDASVVLGSPGARS